MPIRRSRCARAEKRSSRSPRALRCEQLEPRLVLSSIGMLSGLGTPPLGDIAPAFHASATVNAGPAVAKAASAGAGSIVTGNSTSLSVLGSDAQGESTLKYTWSVNSAPQGGSAAFSSNGTNASKNDTVTFNRAGVYTLSVKIVDAAGLSTTSSVQVNVAQTLTSIAVYAGGVTGPVAPNNTVKVSGIGEGLSAIALDQFGNPLITQPNFAWSATAYPTGAAPTPVGSNGNVTLYFSAAGAYSETISASGANGVKVSTKALMNVVAMPNSMTVDVVGGNATIMGASAQFTVSPFLDQFHNPISTATVVSWNAMTMPGGAAAPRFTNNGSTSTATFSSAGYYVLRVVQADQNNDILVQTIGVTVAQVPTGTLTGTAIACTGTSQALPFPTFVDQFGKPITSLGSVVWIASTVPSGATAPSIVTSGGTTTATFSSAGTYVFKAEAAGSGTASYSVTVNVAQVLTSITTTPGTASVTEGGAQQFTAQGLDQFKNTMATHLTYTWTASGGTINSSGLFTAQNSAASDTISAKSGTISASASVTVSGTTPSPSPSPAPAPSPGPAPTFQDATLGKLVAGLDADGSISRNDMITILDTVEADGKLSAADFTDLKTIVANASYYDMPDYVRVLANDVVNGNAANATYQGAALGNLAIGSSAGQFGELIGKWFLGSDLPVVSSSSLTYTLASGSLFPSTPSHNNEFQGELGDCYFISSLGMIADSNPQAIENMFINNGDGTYTVRFYTGTYGAFYNANGTVSDGFTSGTGTADYVTVNSDLVTFAGTNILAYADYGQYANSSSLSLWIPLAEKAYAEWNQTGNEGRDGTNNYSSIEGGWMSTVSAQVLGYNATDYGLSTSSEQAMINAIAAHEAVTIGTDTNTSSYGLYGSHAYGVIGYNASAGLFTLYNPWGMDQPSLLTWPELEATCDGYVVANPSGSVPIPGANVHAAMLAADVSAFATPSDQAAAVSTASNVSVWAARPAVDSTATIRSGGVADSGAKLAATAFLAEVSHDNPATDAPASLSAAGVDAVLASVDFGRSFAA